VGRQAVDPGAGRDRLTGLRIEAEAGPAPLAGERLVGDGSFDDEDERIDLPVGGAAQDRQELVAVLVGEHGVVQEDPRHAGQRAQDQILDTGLGGGGHRDGIAIAAEAGGHPDDVHLGESGRVVGLRGFAGHRCSSCKCENVPAVPVCFTRGNTISTRAGSTGGLP
jgi:hypothetical protein